MRINRLYNFISPVTGRIPIDENYILTGDYNNLSVISPKLIDIQLDLINIRHKYDNLISSNFILGFPNPKLPNSQVLSYLNDGFIFNTGGVVSTKLVAPVDAKYVLNTPHPLLNNAQSLSDLSGGILKSSSTTGIISIASGGQNPILDDYIKPMDLIEQIQETKNFATIKATEAKIEAISYFTTQMFPYVPSAIPFTNIGYQITYAIASAAAIATDAKNSADNANNRISNLSLSGDVNGINNGSDILLTTFTPNPRFTGTEYIKIPTGTTLERPLLAEIGMTRYNIEI